MRAQASENKCLGKNNSSSSSSNSSCRKRLEWQNNSVENGQILAVFDSIWVTSQSVNTRMQRSYKITIERERNVIPKMALQ